MILFLARHFIKDSQNISDAAVRQKYGMLSGIIGICFNILLSSGKIAAGVLSGSIAIVADALNNLSDAGSSIITLIGFKMSGKKADADHPFGHGRIEYITGLIVSMIIVIMGFQLAINSVAKIAFPEPIIFSFLPVVILTASIGVKFYMAYYNTAIGKKINSPAMRAAAMDSFSDCIATGTALLSMILTEITGIPLDGAGGLLVACFVMYTGYRAARETVSPLLGLVPDRELLHKVKNIIKKYPETIGMHDLIVHDYGPGRRIITVHVEVPSSGNLLELHDVIDSIEYELSVALHCDATIHMDPIDMENDTVTCLREQVCEQVRAVDARITVHDFRTISGKTHTNIIFDMVLPSDEKIKEEEIRQSVINNIHTLNPTYHCKIKIDRT